MELTLEQILQIGISAHNSGNLEEAESLYASILQRQPNHPNACHNLGLIANSTGDLERAISLFKTALESDPGVEQFWISYIKALVENNDTKGVKKALKKAKKAGFSEKKLRMLLVTSKNKVINKIPPSRKLKELGNHYRNANYAEAKSLANSLVNDFPNHAFAWKILAAIYKAHGDYKNALDSGRRALNVAPDDYEVHYNLGNTLEKLGRFEDAEFSYLAAVALRPDFAEAYCNLGMVYEELGRMREAENCYSKAISLIPDFTQALRNRCLLLFHKKEFLSAQKDADQLVKGGYQELDLTTLYAAGRTEEAYQRIVARYKCDPDNVTVAAFSAFISAVKSTKTANNFCPNPFDYVYFNNMSEHLKNRDEFIAQLILELSSIDTVWEPAGKSTLSGYQTRHDINILSLGSKKISQLRLIILKELEAYKDEFKDKDCSLIERWPLESSLFGWHVVLKKQGYQKPHIHSSGWISGVIYLQTVRSGDGNEGAIEFSLNGPNYHHPDAPTSVFLPKPGDIVLFPSSLHHRTIPFTVESDRIVVAFDLMPTKRDL